MNIKHIVLSLLLCSSVAVSAQTLSGDYQGYLYRNYYIGKYEKGRYVLIDSLQLDAKGTFVKPLDAKLYTPNTLYVVASEGEYQQNKGIANPHPHGSIRFVYMGKDVSYQTSWRQETGYLSFISGGEPSNHIKELNTHLGKTQNVLVQMEQLLAVLEESDPLYKNVMKSYVEKTTAFNTYCKDVAANYPKGSYMNLYALMYQQVVPQKGMNFKDFQTHRAKNLFQFTDLKNPMVANIPLLPTIYRVYLSLNQPSGMAMSDVIEKMQSEAREYIQKNAAPEILAALNMQSYRPQVQVWRDNLVKDINFDSIYQNREVWFAAINEALGAYDKAAPYHHLFGKDMIAALERTQKPQAYTMLAEAAFSITEQFGWDAAQTEIVEYLTAKSDERLLKGSGKVAMIYAMKNLKIGSKAPDLVITEHIGKVEDHNHKATVLKSSELATGDYKQTLLVFYQSGCGPCEELMQKLPSQYASLKSKGIRVISISADENEQVFKNSSAIYPWADKYCDFEGKNGANFKSYAVSGTPTLVLLDDSGRIIKRTANLLELFSDTTDNSVLTRIEK